MKKHFAVTTLATLLVLAATGAAFADIGTGNPISDSSLGTSLGTYSSSDDRGFRLHRDIVVLAKDDIDNFRATGQQSDFLKEVVGRMAKLNRVSETAILLELKK